MYVIDHRNPDTAPDRQHKGICVLVEAALSSMVAARSGPVPARVDDWVRELTEALMAESETLHLRVVAALRASGVGGDELFERYVPDAARLLGEYWVQDRASFVEVTVGTGRLQRLIRERGEAGHGTPDRTVPLGQSVLMVVPRFEDHSLGAFVAADQFRRHGIWVHVAIGLGGAELSQQVMSRRYAMIGLTGGSLKVLEELAGLVDALRTDARPSVPIVLGGCVVALTREAGRITGVDHAVSSVREAIARCGLVTVAGALSSGAA
ncbi:cobalamin B12-binding domain-containing protein [Limimaricola pyoseonensis]|uniref:B12 binding domain-containing protein n=1 Tax=Limimaricola pyoseonensis TaxID=521013 RepID=A0A1G7AZY5_9RHOB|nr:cobalamin B12-binding domain-containing protein [Limimaricola pyoseonensis]SDE20262.1 hypothetical protein SAMN04488567_1177 [Limimaricola pyoseonensis]